MGQRGRKNRSPLELEPLEKGKDKERARENTLGKIGEAHLNIKIERECL